MGLDSNPRRFTNWANKNGLNYDWICSKLKIYLKCFLEDTFDVQFNFLGVFLNPSTYPPTQESAFMVYGWLWFYAEIVEATFGVHETALFCVRSIFMILSVVSDISDKQTFFICLLFLLNYQLGLCG